MNINTLKSAWCKAAAFAMTVATSATLPMAARAAWSTESYSKQYNGVEWYFRIDKDAHTASIGTNLTTVGYSVDANYALTEVLQGACVLPESFTIDGVNYRVTTIGNRSLMNLTGTTTGVRSLVFPGGVGYIYNCACWGITNNKKVSLESVCFRGPVSVSAGDQETVTLQTADGTGQVFGRNYNLKTVFVGPNVKAATSINYTPRFPESSAYTIFLPKNSTNATWSNYNPLGKDPNVVYYGPEEGLDFKLGDTTLYATVRTVGGLTNLLNHVTVFKNDFGMETKINVVNALDLTGVTFTSEMVADATFDSLMFKVKTQAELDAILAAIPDAAPIAIDPSEITENLTIPVERKVYVQLSKADAVKLKVKGFMIIVK